MGSSLMSMKLSLRQLFRTSPLLQPRGRWNLKCRLRMLTLMKCPLKPRFARIRLPRLWLMLPVLPMSSCLNKMETRIRELESEMDAEGRRMADAQKNLRRSERRIKELTFAGDEDRKNHERMQGLIDNLQAKIKTYKKQLEEAEEIAALNLAKFRKVQVNLQESSNVAEVNECALAKARARGRSTSVGPQ